MISQLIDQLKTDLALKPWAGMVAGIALPQHYTNTDKKVEKIPVACRPDAAVCNEGSLASLIPDVNQKSIIFFEDLGSSNNGGMGRVDRIESNVKLICWVNWKKLGESDCSPDNIMQEVIGTFANYRGNIGQFLNVNVKLDSIAPSTYDIWNRYSFKSGRRAYMMAPYTAFAVTFKITFLMRSGCYTALIPSAEIEC